MILDTTKLTAHENVGTLYLQTVHVGPIYLPGPSTSAI